MKLKVDIKTNINIKGVMDKVTKAAKESLKDTTVAIAGDTIKGSPWLTGNNARSIKYEIGLGEVAQGELEAAVYSTSGYGGMLETGTVRRPATPYFKPALDRNIGKLAQGIKKRLS